MLAYITLGAADLERSGAFWAAILPPLGYAMHTTDEGIAFTAPDGSAIYVKHPFDGTPPLPGNGPMAAFRTETQAQVRTLHEAGLAAGGTDEGAPGFRAAYSPHFYVAYLRDPLGNKLAIFCANPAEGTRP